MKFSKFLHFAAVLICLSCVMLLCACSSPEKEKTDIRTSLSISSSFSGTRTVIVSYPNSVAAPGSDFADNLERIIYSNCPSSMTYTCDTNSGKVVYTFTLAFSSFSDYNSKLTDLLGDKPSVAFANPNTALTTGWRIEEGFQSSQLLSWIENAAHAEQIYYLDNPTSESSTSVVFNNESVSTVPTISVNKLTGYPIRSIKINTVNKNSLYDRTITFKIDTATFDALGNKISDYFKSVTDSSASTDWMIENKVYTYTVKFTDITIKQLEGYTNRLMYSVYGDAEYIDKDTGSTPLAYQNSFTETLDFSNYVSNNNSNVPVEYTYSVLGTSELDACRLYIDSEWVPAEKLTTDNNSGKKVGITESLPLMILKINDGKQYNPKNIDICLTPMDNEQMQKEYSFCYEISSNGYEASNYTAEYFRNSGIQATETANDSYAICTITFTGSPASLNSKITDIFGDDNLITISSYVPFMTLRTTKHIEDKIDLSSLLVGKNINTPVTYTLKARDGESARSLTIKTSDEEEPENIEKKDGCFTTLTKGSKAFLTSEISTPNVSDIILFCTLSVIIILIAIAMIFFLKNKKIPAPALKSGANGNPTIAKPKTPPALPEKKTLLKKEGKKHED